MDIFDDVYKKLRKSFIDFAFILVCLSFFFEVAVSCVLLRYFSSMIKLPLIPYIFFYIALPSTINYALVLFGRYSIESTKFSLRTQNYISIMVLTGICFILSCVHNVYAVASCSLCFPIYVSVLFSDRKLTRDVSILSFFCICISTIFAKFDGRANDSLLFINTFITLDLLISSYLISRYLIKLEIEKNILLKTSFLKQTQLEERLKYDPLTNLYNMSTFYSVLEATLSKSNEPLSIAVIDIDNFKSINDTWGHETGNQVLVFLAQLLQSYCSSTGYVFRYGGEEFTVIFPSKSALQAKVIIEAVQVIFATHEYAQMPKTSITFSCGIATYPSETCSPQDFFQLADKAMYQAKSNGKNRTVIH